MHGIIFIIRRRLIAKTSEIDDYQDDEEATESGEHDPHDQREPVGVG